MVIGLVVTLIRMSPSSNRTGGTDTGDHQVALVRYEREPHTLDELLALEPEQLEQVDIARMNLLCAAGLPGAENLDVETMLDRLDDWARQTAVFTNNSLPDFHSRPHDFDNSEAKFRMLLILSVLQKEFGVHYQEDGFDVNDNDARYPTIVGMMRGEAGGNCASMPVLYVAVGRRLGYPVSLVLGKTHIFARWDGTAETGTDDRRFAYRTRFNIEGTNPMLSTHPDAYYRNWPYPISDAEVAQGWYLKPLTAAKELAVFMAIRGHVFMENGRYAAAHEAFVHSYRLAPHNPEGRSAVAWAHAAMNHGALPMMAQHRGRVGSPPLLESDMWNQIIDGRAYHGVHPRVAQRMATEARMFERQRQYASPQPMPGAHPTNRYTYSNPMYPHQHWPRHSPPSPYPPHPH